MRVKLIKLSREYEAQLGEMIEEWKPDQEINHTDRSPIAIFKNDYKDFIDRVLMTCDKSNTGSAKSIINNGGVLENEIVRENGELLQRYRITPK